MLLSELPPIWLHVVPLVEPLIMRDLDYRWPSHAGRLSRPSMLASSQLTLLHPPERIVTGYDVSCRPHPDDTDPDFLNRVYQLK